MNIKTLLANKHTSIAAVIYVLCKFGAELGAVWYPLYADKFKATANIVEGAAVAYGLFAAGDAGQSAAATPTDKANKIESTIPTSPAVQKTP